MCGAAFKIIAYLTHLSQISTLVMENMSSEKLYVDLRSDVLVLNNGCRMLLQSG